MSLCVQDYRKKASIVEKQLKLARFFNSLVRCKAFIRTKAEPPVYFLPTKKRKPTHTALILQYSIHRTAQRTCPPVLRPRCPWLLST